MKKLKYNSRALPTLQALEELIWSWRDVANGMEGLGSKVYKDQISTLRECAKNLEDLCKRKEP